MPGVVSRGSRGRRSMNEINMVPFIDVMLVLLIIFMVTAPLITTGVVELPSVGRSAQRPPAVIEVIVGTDERLRLRVDGGEPVAVLLPQLAARVKREQGSLAGAGSAAATAAAAAQVPVIISADRNVRYDSVVQVMDTLQRAGVQRVGLSVRQGG